MNIFGWSFLVTNTAKISNRVVSSFPQLFRRVAAALPGMESMQETSKEGSILSMCSERISKCNLLCNQFTLLHSTLHLNKQKLIGFQYYNIWPLVQCFPTLFVLCTPTTPNQKHIFLSHIINVIKVTKKNIQSTLWEKKTYQNSTYINTNGLNLPHFIVFLYLKRNWKSLFY